MSEITKGRVTLAQAVNSIGTDKLKLFVIYMSNSRRTLAKNRKTTCDKT
jgi:hypothetical protein